MTIFFWSLIREDGFVVAKWQRDVNGSGGLCGN
jgi:hypothetical protein